MESRSKSRSKIALRVIICRENTASIVGVSESAPQVHSTVVIVVVIGVSGISRSLGMTISRRW